MVTAKDLLTLADSIRADSVSSEAEYQRIWQEYIQVEHSPEEVAYIGGVLADRLAFLFIAGYQAAVRRTFDLTDKNWTVLAVSEDKSLSDPKPGLSLTADGLLCGYKTWVASSDFMEKMIVSTGTSEDLRLWKVDRNQRGLTLHRKNKPAFLGEMSQGIGEFDRVIASELQELPSIDLKLFSKREPLYLYIAFCGFLHKKLPHPESETLLNSLLVIATGDFSLAGDKQLFAEVDRQIGVIFNVLDPGLFSGEYQQDKGLMRLYSKVIQKRAGFT